MATEAQIHANRKNAQRSTGPRTEGGKARARLNALKDGARAKTVAPVLPQEDPRELDERIRRWVEDLQPANAVERELVARAARISWQLDRAERYETARLARRVRKAQLRSAERTTEKVCDLGRKLLYMSGARILPTSGPPWDDKPAAFLRGLESSAEGCRWLLQRWGELGDMLERGAIWTLTDLFRSIRLQGKHPIDAINDPDLNLQFLAWEVMAPEAAVDFWGRCLKLTPRYDPGFSGFMEWREIADRPGDEAEAMDTIKGMIAAHIERLEELLAVHEEIAGEEAAELADAASFDPGPGFERLRRYQAAKGRELKQTLELFMKLRKGSAAPPRESAIRKPGGEAPTGEAEVPRPGNASDAGVERGRSEPPKRERRPAPFILPGALEMVLADGLADQVRELVRGQGVANPTATNVRSPRPQQVQSPPGTFSESGAPGANEAKFT